MVTLTMDPPTAGKIVNLPTREEIRDMLARPSVAITAIICGTLFALGAVAGVVYLAATGKGVEAVGVFILAMLTAVLGKMNRLHGEVRAATSSTTEGSTDGR